jgi:hypothetical protein
MFPDSTKLVSIDDLQTGALFDFDYKMTAPKQTITLYFNSNSDYILFWNRVQSYSIYVEIQVLRSGTWANFFCGVIDSNQNPSGDPQQRTLTVDVLGVAAGIFAKSPVGIYGTENPYPMMNALTVLLQYSFDDVTMKPDVVNKVKFLVYDLSNFPYRYDLTGDYQIKMQVRPLFGLDSIYTTIGDAIQSMVLNIGASLISIPFNKFLIAPVYYDGSPMYALDDIDLSKNNYSSKRDFVITNIRFANDSGAFTISVLKPNNTTDDAGEIMFPPYEFTNIGTTGTRLKTIVSVSDQMLYDGQHNGYVSTLGNFTTVRIAQNSCRILNYDASQWSDKNSLINHLFIPTAYHQSGIIYDCVVRKRLVVTARVRGLLYLDTNEPYFFYSNRLQKIFRIRTAKFSIAKNQTTLDLVEAFNSITFHT